MYALRNPGLGEYPGYYCYDANRPSWLPYWLDSITESTCKYSPSTIAGNIKACATGDASCNPPTAAQANPELSGPGVATPGTVVNVPTCTGAYELDLASNTCKLNFASTPMLLAIGGAGLGLLTLVLATGGRRR
jgi:hypothetical protein